MSFIEADRLRPATFAWLPQRRVRRGRIYDRIVLAILVAASVVVAVTFRDYGISTDEEVQNTYGQLLLHFYSSGLHDTRAFQYSNLYLYGGLFDLLVALLTPVSPLSAFDTRHLLCAAFGMLGIVATWRLARHVAGPRAGLLAVVLLLLCPSYYGAMFNDTKDIPFAVGMTWMLYTSCRVVARLPRPPLGSVTALGVAAGASLGIRVGAVLGGLYLVPAVLWQLIAVARSDGLRASTAAALALVPKLLLALVLALLLMALFWPWSVMAPGNILSAVQDLTAFHVPTMLDGQKYDSHDVPASYLLTYLTIKVPEIILFGLSAAVLATASARLRSIAFETKLQWMLVALAVTVPVLYALIARPALYHGIRHFLFMLPPLCVIAAAGIDWALAASSRFHRGVFLALAVALGLAALKDVWTMVALHPHQYVYYNVFAGGVRGADQRYEMDYWQNFGREATSRLEAYVQAENGGRLPAPTYSIDVCVSPWLVEKYMPANFRPAKDWREADFFIATTNAGCADASNGRIIIRIERMGVVLGVVKDRRAEKAASASKDATPTTP